MLLVGAAAVAWPAAVSAQDSSPAAPSRVKPLGLTFIDVGHGDACLVQCPDGQNILIDGGFRYYESFVIKALKKAGVKKLDMIIATHPHADHVGGLAAVIKAFPVDLVLDSGKPHPTPIYRDFLETIKTHPAVKYKMGRAGQVFRFGKVTMKILHPGNRLSSNINNCSIVCRLTYGDFSVLFTGDAEKEAEAQIRRRGYTLKSDVLKVGHHGSNTSTTRPFLRAISPKVAVVSSSAGSSRRYHAEVLRRLRTAGIKVFRTSENGTILIESDGKGFKVTPSREGGSTRGIPRSAPGEGMWE